MPLSRHVPVLRILRLALLAGAFLAGEIRDARAVPQQRPDSAGTPELGVVWTPPTSPDSALHELTRIHRAGATAVRLTRPPADTVAARADSLGLRLYVDLAVRAVPASRLASSLARADSTLDRLAALAERHPSLTHVGLARGSPTTEPDACDVLADWTSRVHDRVPSLRTYYVTPFPAPADQCAEAVDRLLLDLRGQPHPVERWRAWRAQTSTVGIGALGTWTRPSASSGLHVPHSPERQARYLETALSGLLDSVRTAPPDIFVARWRDAAAPLLSSRRYGLHSADGTPRPAASVVRGFYTGTQRAFAFSSGTPPPTAYGLVLLGWGLVALLGGVYASSLFVRQTVVRYFTAPGFYRDALRDGRDLSAGTNGLLLGIVAGGIGVVAARTAQLLAAHPSTELGLRALSESLQSVFAWGVEHPPLAGLLVAGIALGALLLWGGALVGTARLQTRFSVSQGLVLVTWPCWPFLLGVPVALATGPQAPLSPSLFGLLLLGGGALALLSVSFRVLHDYWRIAEPPAWALLPLFALSPLALTGTALLLGVYAGLPLRYLWVLALHT